MQEKILIKDLKPGQVVLKHRFDSVDRWVVKSIDPLGEKFFITYTTEKGEYKEIQPGWFDIFVNQD